MSSPALTVVISGPIKENALLKTKLVVNVVKQTILKGCVATIHRDLHLDLHVSRTGHNR